MKLDMINKKNKGIIVNKNLRQKQKRLIKMKRKVNIDFRTLINISDAYANKADLII